MTNSTTAFALSVPALPTKAFLSSPRTTTCSRSQTSSFLGTARPIGFFARDDHVATTLEEQQQTKRSIGRWTMMPIGVPKVSIHSFFVYHFVHSGSLS